jgi:uncharacterized protein YndB with AHSA1/START domain
MTFSCEKVGLEFFDAAPTRYQAIQEITATPEQVFDVLLDADSWVRWAMPITAVEWTSGFPIEVGSTRTVHMRGGLVGYEEFIAYEHGVRMAFRFNEMSKDTMKAFAEDYRVTDLGGGRCRVEWTMAMKTARDGGFMSKLTGPIMSFMVRRMLRKFSRLVESSAQVTTGEK